MMKRVKSYAVIVLAIVVVAVLTILWVIYQDPGVSWRASISVGLSSETQIGDDVWVLEVVNVTGSHPPEHEDLAEFRVRLNWSGPDAKIFSPLRNGLCGHSYGVAIFFEDNGKMGRLDKGDMFYLVGLEPGSEYGFQIVFNRSQNFVGHASLSP